MKRILVGIDGSDESKAALRLAVALAPALNAGVQLVHVERPTPSWAPHAVALAATGRRYGVALLAATASENQTPGVALSTELLSGEAGSCLAEAARDSGVALIAVGSKGAGRAARVLLGSACDRAIQQSDKPVLVVKGDAQPPGRGRSVLVGVDGSPESNTAVHFAAELAWSCGAELRVACAVEAALAPVTEPYPPARARADLQHQEWAHSLLREVVAREERKGLVIQTSVPTGLAAETLAEIANQDDVALVVVGHRGRGAVARLLVGSTADRLAQIASKPVLIVR